MKKEEVTIGAKVVYNHNNNLSNGLELEVIGQCYYAYWDDKRTYRVKCKITKLAKDPEDKIGEILEPVIDCLELIEPLKPHVYSPVLMTGRYKTIGD